jgi:hypothetical protein
MDTMVPEETFAPVRGRRRWRWVAAGVVVLVGAGAATAAGTGMFGHSGKPPVATYPTSTATVAQRALQSQTQVSATLGYGGAFSVVNQAQGVVTTLPGVGRVVRQGQVFYRVSGQPVVLLYGAVPAYRSLSYGMKGQDVAELNAALVALGYATRADLDPGSDYFSSETTYALERLQRHLGVTRTGELTLGQAVFLPDAARVTAIGGGTVLGGPVHPGTTLLSATSTDPVVTINLDAGLQTQIKRGNRVVITLPDNRTTPGVVSSVGSVATKTSTGATISVKVTPTHPKAADGLDEAPVQVSIVTGSVADALVVPVSALIAQPGGTYAVEVADPRGNRLVAVTPGLFDDADGLVQVTGTQLTAGQRVVVPTS